MLVAAQSLYVGRHYRFGEIINDQPDEFDLHMRAGGLGVQGRPIVSAECLCTDCQNAGAFLQSLPGAPPVLDQKGATRFVLYRKDRVRCERGQDCLREHRLSKDSKTRRVIAICCSTPMFLEFTNGHWLSIYGGLGRRRACLRLKSGRWPAIGPKASNSQTMYPIPIPTRSPFTQNSFVPGLPCVSVHPRSTL